MKKLKFYILILLLINYNSFFSQKENLSTFSLTPVVFENNMQHEPLDPRLVSLLKNKMRRIASKYGFSSGIKENRHIIFPDFQVITKDVVKSIPPKVSVEILLTFYIADYDTRTIYASEEFNLLGVGPNETKAYYSALNRIRSNNPKLKILIEKGKKKIIEFYNTHCDQVINAAKTKAKTGHEEMALSMLTRIPPDCSVCYDKALKESVTIYKQIQKRKCNENLVKAKNIWATDHSYDAAVRVEPYLSQILPDFPCYTEAVKLINKIDRHLKEKEKKEWQFKMEQEKRRREMEDREFSLREKMLQYRHAESMARIDKTPEKVYVYPSWW